MATKLEKHMEALEEATSGGAHDAVTFSGRGLGFLRELFKGAKKMSAKDEDDMEDGLFDDVDDEGDEERDDDAERDADEDEDEDTVKKTRRAKKSARAKKSSRKDWEYEANGGDLEEVDYEDDEDPGQEGDEEIITNHGRRVNAKYAVQKNARGLDARRFAKSMQTFEQEYDDVLDASDALRELSKHVRVLGKSAAASQAGFAEVQQSLRLLAKAVGQSLQAQASMAADLELVKKQPGAMPSSGVFVMQKGASGSSKGRKLSKSDIADVVNDAMIEGLVDHMTNARIATLYTQAELNDYVNNLPAEVQARL